MGSRVFVILEVAMANKAQTETKVKLLLFDTYLAMIKNSVGSNLFRNVYAEVNGERRDVTEDGVRSCALFVSAILRILNLLKKRHTTASSTVKDLKESGWYRIRKPRPGAVLVWEKKKYGSVWHSHIGFYIDRNKAISNRTSARVPMCHHWTFKGKRKVEAIYWHRKLGTDK